METKSLLYGLIGFFLGGLVVSVAATTLDRSGGVVDRPMSHMTQSLAGMKGDDYDKAFIENMIMHHESAVDMARLSESRATHPEIKKLSLNIIATQQSEIEQMKTWHEAWGYEALSDGHRFH